MNVKNMGFLGVSFHLITDATEDPTKKISDALFDEIVCLLAKYEIISDRIILDFTDCIKCEQTDLLHATLIEAGKRIQAEKQLTCQLQKNQESFDKN